MEDPSFIFSSGPMELKEEGENFFVEGYISTSDIDLVNDIVTKACLLDMAEQMRQRTIKLDVEHESFKGKTDLEVQINKTIIPAAKIEDFLMDKKGLKVRAMLNKHIQRFQEVKNSIRDGFLDAFSIAFVPVKETIQQKDGQEVRMLDKINLLNVAFTGNPVNTNASIDKVFLKSLDFLEDQKAKKPKKPKPQPDPHKEPEEEEEDEEKGCGKKPKKKKKEIKPSVKFEYCKTCGSKLTHSHSKDDTIKLQEVKNMEEDNKEEETTETQEEGKEEGEKEEAESTESESTETKDEESSEEPGEKEEEKKEESDAEVKALKLEVKSLKKEMAEIKAKIKMPVRKSKVEQQDKSEQFVGEKVKDPLDLIA